MTTPGQTTPRDITFQSYLKPRTATSSTARNKGIVSSEILLQSSEHPKLDFVGREANDDADSQLKHYVAVVDPAEKSWRFVEVRRVTLRGAVRQVKHEEDSSDEEMVSPAALPTPREY